MSEKRGLLSTGAPSPSQLLSCSTKAKICDSYAGFTLEPQSLPTSGNPGSWRSSIVRWLQCTAVILNHWSGWNPGLIATPTALTLVGGQSFAGEVQWGRVLGYEIIFPESSLISDGHWGSYTAWSLLSENPEYQQRLCLKDLERVQRRETKMTKEEDNGAFDGKWKRQTTQPGKLRDRHRTPVEGVFTADLPSSIFTEDETGK